MTVNRVLASFTHRSDAQAAAARAASEFPEGNPRMGDTDDTLDVLAMGQEAELEDSVPMISAGIFTGPFARGALVWGLVGLVVGALVGVAVSLLFEPDGVAGWTLAVAFAFAGALAVSSATFVLGAGRRAVKEGATTPEDPTAVVRVDADADQADAVVSFFVEQGARSARFVDRPISRLPTSEVEAPHPTPGRPSSERAADYDAGFTADMQ